MFFTQHRLSQPECLSIHLFCLPILALTTARPLGHLSSLVWKDALYPTPSPKARVLVDVSLLPVYTCPDRSASTASEVSHSSSWPSVFLEGKLKVASTRRCAPGMSGLACSRSNQYPICSEASADS